MADTIQPADKTRFAISFRSAGRVQGPVVRLVSPGDVGQMIKPFVFLDYLETKQAAGGFGWHPHSGIATVTLLLEGSVNYEDSTGRAGRLKAGGVEYMQAGNGVWHVARPVSRSRPMRGYQLWLALPESVENAAPKSQYLEPEDVAKVGPARVIVGSYSGAVSPLPNIASINYLHVRLNDGEVWNYDVPEAHDVTWIAVDDGSLVVSGVHIRNEIAVFQRPHGRITFIATGNTNFVLGSAARHPHELVTGYYSVHTSAAALEKGERGIMTVSAELKRSGKIID